MFGLPGSGKTTWIKDNGYNLPDSEFLWISADEIKIHLPLYNPKLPDLVHEESVRIAEELVYSTLKTGNNFILDGGGINNNYTKTIIDACHDHGYFVSLIHIDTPLEVCLERNNERILANERFVPPKAIIEKGIKLNACLNKIIFLVDAYVKVPYYTDKHVFVDMDGVVAAHQSLYKNEEGNVDFVNGEVFRYAPPVWPVINKLEQD